MVTTHSKSTQDTNLHKNDVPTLPEPLGKGDATVELDQPDQSGPQGLDKKDGQKEGIPVTVQKQEWMQEVQLN